MVFESFNAPLDPDPDFDPQDKTLQRLLHDLDRDPNHQPARSVPTTKPEEILVNGSEAPVSPVPSVPSPEEIPTNGLKAQTIEDKTSRERT